MSVTNTKEKEMDDLTKEIIQKETRTEAEDFWLIAEFDLEVALVSNITVDEDLRDIKILANDIKIKYKCDYTSDLNAIRRVELKLANSIYWVRYVDRLILIDSTSAVCVLEFISHSPQQLFLALAETIAEMVREEIREKNDG